MTLTEFLLARIAEDEDEAHMPWCDDPSDIGGRCGRCDMAVGRVLAECEAKRRLMDLHPPRWVVVWHDEAHPTRLVNEGDKVKVAATGGPIYDLELRLLAMPYADHSDYRDEWKP